MFVHYLGTYGICTWCCLKFVEVWLGCDDFGKNWKYSLSVDIMESPVANMNYCFIHFTTQYISICALDSALEMFVKLVYWLLFICHYYFPFSFAETEWETCVGTWHMICASSTIFTIPSFFKYQEGAAGRTKTNTFSVLKYRIFWQIEVKFKFYHIHTHESLKFLAFNFSFRTCNYILFELIFCLCSLLHISGWKSRKRKFLSFENLPRTSIA